MSVWNDASDLYVKYETTGDWCLAETHLHVATSLEDIPQKNGSPLPGQFEYKSEHDCVTEYTYAINYAERGWTCDTQFYIAAHAAVRGAIIGYEDPNLDSFAAALPTQVTMSVQYPYRGEPAYFPVTTVTGDPLTGTYEGWCVDTDHTIGPNVTYTANVFSSYEPLPHG